MSQATELTVILKDEESTYRQKFLLYTEYTVSQLDETIRTCISEARKNFKDVPEDIIVRIQMVVQ